MSKLLLCISFLLWLGCAEKEKGSRSVFFAGEIVNPTSDYVVLYRGDVIIDSANLDDQNRFVFKLDSIREGLHHFYHHPELQYVYMEPGDSLQIRLNTLNFDESLIFSGKGGELNNFMLEMFLANEEEEPYVSMLYSLEPEEFSSKNDSLRHQKEEALDALDKETHFSRQAYAVAKAEIEYSSYISKEAYPFYHKKKKGDKSIHELSQDFYDYRKNINYEDERLIYLRSYYNFIKYHLGNLAYMNCHKACDMENGQVTNQLHFNQHKLVIIDSLIKQKELRDNLFRSVAVDYLLKHDSEANIKIFIDKFHKLSVNNKHIEEIDGLYEGIRRMQPNNELPDLIVYNTEGDEVSLKDIASNKEVVFYFWSGIEPGHFRNITQHIAKLRVKHPEYTFVGINLRTDNTRWKSLLESSALNRGEQYWSDNFAEIAHTLLVYDPNKSIIAKDGVIVNAFANVYSSF